jgi:hypothetical protein
LQAYVIITGSFQTFNIHSSCMCLMFIF